MTQNDRDWLKNAKKAAKAFAKKVLTGDPNVRIAVVAYAAKTINDWDFSSKLATVEQHIDDINTNNGNWHGTNIQAGIHSARERFKKSDKDADKFMIVLADGAPNCRFGIYSASETWRLTSKQAADYHIKTDYREGGKQYFPNLYTANSTTFSYNNSDIMDEDSGYCYTATVSEAYAAKATDGITCYAIGYGIAPGSSLINALMYSISSTDAGFVNAGTDVNAITKVFSDIATDIQYKAHDVTLTDTMGAGFTYLANETYPSNPVVTPSADNKTVTWNVADKLGDETKTLTFYVQYDKQNLTDAETLPTNTSASLSYKDNKGNAQTPITVDSPAIENLAFTVTYLDETGTELTDAPYTKTRYWHGDTVAIEKGPVKTGYDFTVWTVTGVTPAEGATSFDMPKNNVTLKANYTEKDYLLSTGVYYISDNVVPPDSVLYSYSSVGSPRLKKDAQVTLPDFVDVQDSEHDGVWKFLGWYEYYGLSTARKYEGTFTMPARDVSLDAVWTFQKTERYGVEVTKTATRDRILANGTTETVDLVNEVSVVRADDVIHYTVTIENTGNVAFGAGDRGQDNFTAVGTLIGEDGNIEGGKYGDIKGVSTLEPGSSVTKYYTYKVLPGDEERGRIANNASAQIKTGPGVDDTIRGLAAVNVKVEKPHGVTYTFENNDGLPTEVQTLLPTQDTKKYYAGDSVTLPTLTENTKTIDGIKYTFAGWYVGSTQYEAGGTYTMGDKDVTFVGKWKSVTVNPKYKLSYVFKSGDDTITTLPDVVTRQIPADSEELVEKTEVELPHGFEDTADTVNKGTWSFDGWYEDKGLSTKIDGTTYRMPEGGKTLYGKWTFEADKPEITEAGYTVEYYRQDADGNYSNKPYYTRTTTDAGVPLKGNVGDTVRIEELEPFYKEHYKGYEFDANNENNVPQCTLQADANKNVLKIYYKALPELEVKKEVDEQYNVKHGDTLTYTITVKNAGARNLTNVKVTDVIDAADPSKLEILPGEGYTYHEESGKIEIGNMAPGDEVVIKATYVVQEADSGHTIKNTATGSADEVEGVQATVSAYPNKIEEFKGDLVISKTYRSDTSTSPAATFYFDVYYMDGDEQISLLDEYAEISFDKNEAKKGAPATKTVEVKLNDVNEKVLESGFYVREVLEDKVDKVVYDRNAVHGFLVPFPLISAYADTDREPITVDREAYVVSTQVYENAGAFWAAWVTDELDENYNVFSFTNTYKTVRTEPVKVGPQLNRDDHVAYIMGYPDGTVQPKGEITRAEACTIFFRLLTDSSRDYYFSKTNDYTDVNAGDWFNNAISTLSNAGIVTGYNDGTFRPNQPITRGEMAKIIANFANLNKGTKSFTDLSGHWSKSYVELAAGNGWIAGYPDGSFRPDQKITRAETVTMINRVLERVPAKELRLLSRSIMLTFPDNNPGDWYYIAIQEASNSHEYQRSVYETTGDEMWTKLIDNVDWTKLEK